MPSCQPGAKHFLHERKGSHLLEYSQDLSGTNSPRRTTSGDVCEDTQHTKKQKECNTRERENNVCSRRITQPIFLVNFADSDDTSLVDGEKYFQSKHHQGSQ